MSLSATLCAAFDEHTGRLSEKRKRGQEEVAGKSAPLRASRATTSRRVGLNASEPLARRPDRDVRSRRRG